MPINNYKLQEFVVGVFQAHFKSNSRSSIYFLPHIPRHCTVEVKKNRDSFVIY